MQMSNGVAGGEVPDVDGGVGVGGGLGGGAPAGGGGGGGGGSAPAAGGGALGGGAPGGGVAGAGSRGSEGAGAYKVGPWVLGRVLGRGSFGKVKLARHERRGVLRAAKILDKEKVRGKGLSAQVRQEVRVMQALEHGNVVKIYEVKTSAEKIFIFMELVEGGELFDEILRQKRLSEPAARFYFRQLVCGLAHCHGRGIFHRDLKPENLLLSKDHQLKISDFGLSSLKKSKGGGSGGGGDSSDTSSIPVRERVMMARGVDPAAVTSSQLLHTQCGTPNYVAPEIITASGDGGKGYSGAKVDLWSSGVILFVLVAGALPFDDQEMEVLFGRILKAQFSVPAHFSPPLVSLIHALLEVNPTRRISLREVCEHPWMQMSDAELADVAGGGLDDVPPTPPGYVARMPWEPEPSATPDEAGEFGDSLEVGGVMHETTTMDSLDFGNARVGILDAQGQSVVNERMRVESDLGLGAATAAAAAVAAASASAKTGALDAGLCTESTAGDMQEDVGATRVTLAATAAVSPLVVGGGLVVAAEGVSTTNSGVGFVGRGDALDASVRADSVSGSDGVYVADGTGGVEVMADQLSIGGVGGVRDLPVPSSPIGTSQAVDSSLGELLPSPLSSASPTTAAAVGPGRGVVPVSAAAFRGGSATRPAGSSATHTGGHTQASRSTHTPASRSSPPASVLASPTPPGGAPEPVFGQVSSASSASSAAPPTSRRGAAFEEQLAVFEKEQQELLDSQAAEHERLIAAAVAATAAWRLAAMSDSHDGIVSRPQLPPRAYEEVSSLSTAPTKRLVATNRDSHHPRRAAGAPPSSQFTWREDELAAVAAAAAAGDTRRLDALFQLRYITEARAALDQSDAGTCSAIPDGEHARIRHAHALRQQQAQLQYALEQQQIQLMLNLQHAQQAQLEQLRKQHAQQTQNMFRHVDPGSSSSDMPRSTSAQNPPLHQPLPVDVARVAMSADGAGSGRGSPFSDTNTTASEDEDRYRTLQAMLASANAFANMALQASQQTNVANDEVEAAVLRALANARTAADTASQQAVLARRTALAIRNMIGGDNLSSGLGDSSDAVSYAPSSALAPIVAVPFENFSVGGQVIPGELGDKPSAVPSQESRP